MRMTFKRAATAGFTLIELLIVVIILAILAAIAIPQFTSATVDARMSALDANLSAVRGALEQYRVQHGMTFPGAAASQGAGAACVGGVAGNAAAGTVEAMQQQLQFFSNAAGQTCSVAAPGFRFGPYLPRGLPLEPFSNSALIAVTNDANAIVPAAGAAAVGWAYNAGTGQFIVNNGANDPDGRAFSLR